MPTRTPKNPPPIVATPSLTPQGSTTKDPPLPTGPHRGDKGIAPPGQPEAKNKN